MNWYALIAGILWSFLLIIAGYYSGWINEKEKTGKESDAFNYHNTQGPPGPTGAMGPPGKDADMSRVEACEDSIGSILDRLDRVENAGSPVPPNYYEDIAAIKSRLTRVERKAGMSV